jgi:hypothetical protein
MAGLKRCAVWGLVPRCRYAFAARHWFLSLGIGNQGRHHMANVLKLLLKGWLLKKLGASGCLVVVIFIVVVAMLLGYVIAN